MAEAKRREEKGGKLKIDNDPGPRARKGKYIFCSIYVIPIKAQRFDNNKIKTSVQSQTTFIFFRNNTIILLLQLKPLHFLKIS